MRWTFTADPARFPAAAEEWLLRDPAGNTIMLTALDRGRRGLWEDGAVLGWLTPADAPDGTDVRGVVLHTPPYPLRLAALPPEAIAPLAEALRSRPLTGVGGPVARVEAFVAVWGRAPAKRMDERLYRLGTLVEPPLPGRARRAGLGDLGRMVDWYAAFAAEAGTATLDADVDALVRHRIARGELVLWEHEGRIVSFAAFSTPVAAMARIGPVYTPPEHRRRGYGAAVTHAAAVAARAAGATEVLLFADLANPTANSIYQALGFRPAGDHASVHFA